MTNKLTLNAAKAEKTIALTDLPEGASARISHIDGDRTLTRRLLSLGLRIGSEIRLMQHRRQGVVVATEGTRVALGNNVACLLTMQVIENPS